MSEMMEFSDLFTNNADLEPLMNAVQTIMDLPDDSLTDTVVESMRGMINGMITPSLKNESVKAMKDSFSDQGYTRKQAVEAVEAAERDLQSFLDSLKPSPNKKALLETLFNTLYNIFNAAVDEYHSYDIVLPMTLDDGAQVPTYAHDTDACADLYAADTITLPAHSTSNMVRTGVHIQLPEGWMAMIFPRSSIGAKTGLRLSNSCGIIDNHYLGALGVIYDNISDSDYTINAGDRIAQLLVMPSYRFKPDVVEALVETDRGQEGFGSTGK